MENQQHDQPWYRDGLRFTCTQCGDCCSGGAGYVWVTNSEIEEIARQLGMGVDEFEHDYVRKIGIRKSLKEFPNGDCVFLSESKSCGIYESRPTQCRTWPFWDSNLRTPEDWQRTCEECPGSGKGQLYQLQRIERQRTAMKI